MSARMLRILLLTASLLCVDRAEGDVHPQGNPRLNLDPRNIARVADALAATRGLTWMKRRLPDILKPLIGFLFILAASLTALLSAHDPMAASACASCWWGILWVADAPAADRGCAQRPDPRPVVGTGTLAPLGVLSLPCPGGDRFAAAGQHLPGLR